MNDKNPFKDLVLGQHRNEILLTIGVFNLF